MSQSKKKVGLIGCGMVAMYGHLPAIVNADGLEPFAVLDPNPDSLAAAQKQFNVPHAFTEPEAFFRSGIEAVSITSPAPVHLQNALDAARHGLPILCEKPLAMNPAEAAVMITAAKQAGVSLYTAFCYRFSPVSLKIRELVATKAIGDVRSLRLIYNWDCHGKYVTDDNGQRVIYARREGRMIEGGPMVDCGTHQIDLATFWLDSPVTKFTAHGAWLEAYEAPDHMWLHLDHASGAHTVVEISYSYCHTSKNRRSEFVYELIGTEGLIRYDRDRKTFEMENTTGRQVFEFYGEKGFTGMYEEWSRALTTGSSAFLPSAAAGQRVTEIARAATDQAIANRKKNIATP